MNNQELYRYVEEYLKASGSTIIDRGPAHLTARLSEQADREIMNRHYYWLFVERTGAEPEPLTVTFCFDSKQWPEKQAKRTEMIQFGCYRLHQIFESCRKHGRFIRLYEEVPGEGPVQPLTPWICINYKISFVSDQKKDLFYPLGFNLINGEIIAPFDKILEKYKFTPKIPDYHFTLSPIFSLRSALNRIETYLHHFLNQLDQSWAKRAHQRLDGETQLIRSFFQDQDDELLQRRLAEIDAYRPRIDVLAINVGLLFLKTHPRTKL